MYVGLVINKLENYAHLNVNIYKYVCITKTQIQRQIVRGCQILRQFDTPEPTNIIRIFGQKPKEITLLDGLKDRQIDGLRPKNKR